MHPLKFLLTLCGVWDAWGSSWQNFWLCDLFLLLWVQLERVQLDNRFMSLMYTVGTLLLTPIALHHLMSLYWWALFDRSTTGVQHWLLVIRFAGVLWWWVQRRNLCRVRIRLAWTVARFLWASKGDIGRAMQLARNNPRAWLESVYNAAIRVHDSPHLHTAEQYRMLLNGFLGRMSIQMRLEIALANFENQNVGFDVSRFPATVLAEDQPDPCSICRDTLKAGQTLRELPCHHSFHQTCVDPWVTQHANCPMCRRVFAEPAEEEHMDGY